MPDCDRPLLCRTVTVRTQGRLLQLFPQTSRKTMTYQFRIALLALTLSTALVTGARAELSPDAAVAKADQIVEAGNKSAYAQAFAIYAGAAETGAVWAQYNAGEMLYEGKGVRKDRAKAAEYYAAAADQGNAWAQYKLGSMLLTGDGIAPSPSRAVKLLDASAMQGNVWANYILGDAYLEGNRIPNDLTRANFYLDRAAQQNNPWALLRLGEIYRDGRGVSQSKVDAVMLFEQSAAQGNSFAMVALAELLAASDPTRSASLLRDAAKLGNAKAKAMLAD
jgi:TPR repeat protein